MIIEAERRAFLDGLQVGDLVCVVRRWSEWRVHAVTRTTAARVWVGDTQFDRKTGRKWGSGESWYVDDLYPLTTERIKDAMAEMEQRKDQAARKALMLAITPALDTAPLAVLEQIRALLNGGSAGNP